MMDGWEAVNARGPIVEVLRLEMSVWYAIYMFGSIPSHLLFISNEEVGVSYEYRTSLLLLLLPLFSLSILEIPSGL